MESPSPASTMVAKKRKTLMRFIAKSHVSLPERHHMLTKPQLVDWMVKNNLVMLPEPQTEKAAGGARRVKVHLPRQGAKALPLAGIGIASHDPHATYQVKQDGARTAKPVEHIDTGNGIHFIPLEKTESPVSPHTIVIEKPVPGADDAVIVQEETQKQPAGCTIM